MWLTIPFQVTGGTLRMVCKTTRVLHFRCSWLDIILSPFISTTNLAEQEIVHLKGYQSFLAIPDSSSFRGFRFANVPWTELFKVDIREGTLIDWILCQLGNTSRQSYADHFRARLWDDLRANSASSFYILPKDMQLSPVLFFESFEAFSLSFFLSFFSFLLLLFFFLQSTIKIVPAKRLFAKILPPRWPLWRVSTVININRV